MDELVCELSKLRLERQEAVRRYQESIERSNTKEKTLLASIQREQRLLRQQESTERQRDAQFHTNIRNNRQNPIVKGDIVRITNYYVHEEHGITGEVTRVTNRMVELRNQTTNICYSRA